MRNFIKNHFKFMFIFIWFNLAIYFNYNIINSNVIHRIECFESFFERKVNCQFKCIMEAMQIISQHHLEIIFDHDEQLENNQIQLEKKMCEIGNGLKECLKIIYENKIP